MFKKLWIFIQIQDKSKFGTVNFRDIFHGIVVAVFAIVPSTIIEIFSTGQFPTLVNLYTILATSLGAGLSYVAMNVFSNSQNQLFVKEPLSIEIKKSV